MVQYFPIVTGSLTVTGSVNVSGSITTNSTITATTLVVQTITSSISAITGSTNFGSLSTNTHTFTGSLNVTGALAVTTNGVEFQVNSTGVNLGNALTDSHIISGSLRVNPNGLFVSSSGFVGIGTTNPQRLLHVHNTTGAASVAQFTNADSGVGAEDGLLVGITSTEEGAIILKENLPLWFATNDTERMRINANGFVGINNSSPGSRLYVQTTAGATKAYDDTTKTNILVFDDTSMAAGVGGSITFGGYKTAQTNGGNFAAIDGVKENGTAGNESGMFRVWTANSSGIFGERLRIASTGLSTFRASSDSVFTILNLYNTSGTSAGARLNFQNFFGDLGAVLVKQKDNGSGADDGQMEFQVASNAALSTVFTLRNDGLITTAGSTSPYNFDPGGRVMYVNSLGQIGSTSSTRESKININPLTSVDYIMQLNPVSFYHRRQDTETRTYTDEYFDEIKYGFIADEVEKVNLDLVFYNENEDGTKKLAGVEYMSMIAVLTKAIQELTARVQELENK